LTQARIGNAKIDRQSAFKTAKFDTPTPRNSGFFASLQENECPLWQSKTEMAPPANEVDSSSTTDIAEIRTSNVMEQSAMAD